MTKAPAVLFRTAGALAFYSDKILLQLPLYGSKVLEGQGLGADAGVEACRLDGRDDLIFRPQRW